MHNVFILTVLSGSHFATFLYFTIACIKKIHICFENNPRRSPTIHIWCRMYSPEFDIHDIRGGMITASAAESQALSVSAASWSTSSTSVSAVSQ